MRKQVLRFRLAALLIVLTVPTVRAQTPMRVYAAGSLTEAMTEMVAQSGQNEGVPIMPIFGPSGVLREQIEAGAPADILASADMTQPRRLAGERAGARVIMFTRNSLCALARRELGLTPDTVLDHMLDPAVRVATSTPGADPGGDYAWAVFARAEMIQPGAKATLEAKALKLVGGPDSKPLVPGKGQVEGVFLTNAADMMLGYCSGAETIQRSVPDLVSVTLPSAISVGPAYGLIVLTDNPVAYRFALFVMSEAGQAILAKHGFAPVALP
jgi:molybdate transport system substrate-binding protein